MKFMPLALILVWSLGLFGIFWLPRWYAARRFRRAHGPGKNLLLVYSNSPNWQTYIEENWLPRWQRRAVLLNWSERARWEKATPEVALFRAVAGDREFNPVAIVISSWGWVEVVRFWRAFRDYKHGNDKVLREKEALLEAMLSSRS